MIVSSLTNHFQWTISVKGLIWPSLDRFQRGAPFFKPDTDMRFITSTDEHDFHIPLLALDLVTLGAPIASPLCTLDEETYMTKQLTQYALRCSRLSPCDIVHEYDRP